MIEPLRQRLSDCVVNIIANKQGTGFFVAPGLILTCAHVVDDVQQNPHSASIQVFWNQQTYPANIVDIRQTDFLDLALLKVAFTNHPCVLLAGGANTRDRLFSFGYPDIEPAGASTTFESEGWIGQNHEMLRLKGGQARPGMSGSPVLNEETGSVCGIIESTRDEMSDLGSAALPSQAIFDAFPTLVDKQKQFHTQDKRWSDALSQSQREKLHLAWLPALTVEGKLQVFVSYSHKDETFKDDFDTAVVMLRRNELIESWYDGDVEAGKELDKEISSHMKAANIIILLASPSYLASKYCYDIEMKRAMLRHEAKTARVIPIILRPCEWQDAPFGKLKALPKDGKPIAKWADRDEAFLDVARELRRVVLELKKPSSLS